MILEICASNYQSAMNAQEAGAHRIELCSELAVGGITPSYGLLKQVLDTISIPVCVLIRPRSGNFTYSDAEFDIMKRDIQLCKDLGCAGIVSGVLNTDQTIDSERTKELITLSKPLPFTFHRAFDWTPNPLDALETLKQLKIERILTSGQSESAELGIDTLKMLKEESGNDLTILPGGGINSENVDVFKTAGFKEVHASASTIQNANKTPKIKMNSPKLFDETIELYSDIAKIKSILKQITHEN
ncbi:copper homeostasis protein CutC [Flavobacteriales bacterium 34_180_T64]|nr:copper homeostasis protein CutC [Flavobacteriales bacterium 34_180_T64]